MIKIGGGEDSRATPAIVKTSAKARSIPRGLCSVGFANAHQSCGPAIPCVHSFEICCMQRTQISAAIVHFRARYPASSVRSSAKVIMHNLAEAEGEVADHVHRRHDFEYRQLRHRRQRMRGERERGRAGPGTLERHVLKIVFDQLADARRVVNVRK